MGAVVGVIFVVLIIMTLLSLFIWYRQRQGDKGQHIQPSVAYIPALSECGSTVAMHPSTMDVSQTLSLSTSCSSVSAGCFTNPSYHTVSVAPCNLASSTATAPHLDGTLTLQSSTLKGVRNGSEWRAYCNLNDLDGQQADTGTQKRSTKKTDYIKGSMCSTNQRSLSGEKHYASIRDPHAAGSSLGPCKHTSGPGDLVAPSSGCKHTESSYVEMKTPGLPTAHRDALSSFCPAGGDALSSFCPAGGDALSSFCPATGELSSFCGGATTVLTSASRNLYDAGTTVSVLQGPNGMATGFSQNPYDVPRGSHIPSILGMLPSHYDILPTRQNPSRSATPPLPESPSSLL
ncbi:hypothetical protein UPYG_G00273210 [Umbra pygmaea]|uniref:Uncharacterized protein n=1 Tax=Umbra pygmaea TaxID=75934 RepID=A0ABD0WB80_UMBPY